MQAVFDPHQSFWIEASAGTGKTKLLIDRILALVLNNVNMSHIVCLTFTRAAAFEMEERLTQTLKSWSEAPPEQQQEIKKKFNISHPIDFTSLYERHLFGPSVMLSTIHSFCEKIVRLLPHAFDLTTGFMLTDERQHVLLQEEAYHTLTTQYPRTKLDLLFNIFSPSYIKEAVFNARPYLCVRPFKCALLDSQPKPDDTQVKLYLNEITALDKEMGALLTNFYMRGDNKNENDEDLGYPFLTQSGTYRLKLWTKKNHPHAQALNESWKNLIPLFEAQQNRINAKYQQTLNQAFWPFASNFFKIFSHLKRQKNLVDFDDLIEYAFLLLESDKFAPQIAQRLDHQVKHILIDEAQDTNPSQWQVILNLIETFFEPETQRSLFIVGDKKQSIYGFQGADFDALDVIKNKIYQKVPNFKTMTLDKSFRSLPAILTCVDKVFSKDNIDLSMQVMHMPHRQEAKGHVELLGVSTDQSEPNTCEYDNRWGVSLKKEEEVPQWILKLSDHIENLLATQKTLVSTRQMISADDIIILMRNRSKFVNLLIDGLIQKKIPCAGIDRVELSEISLVKEFCSFIRFCLLPEDNLCLWNVLKSFLISSQFEISAEEFYHLVHERGEASVWQHLEKTHTSVFTWLFNMKEKILNLPLSNAVLFYLKNQPYVDNDFANTLLDQAEQTEIQFGHFAFEAFIESINLYLKKVPRAPSQGVRLYTVHGAKGLQAPITYLIDNEDESSVHRDIFIKAPDTTLLKVKNAYDTLETRALKTYWQTQNTFENERLLYVALTRAQDELYIASTKSTPGEESWYTRIQKALAT